MLTTKEYMDQAADTAVTQLRRAIRDIDAEFGPGFARANPTLVAAYMHAASADFTACFGLQGISTALDRVADALGE